MAAQQDAEAQYRRQQKDREHANAQSTAHQVAAQQEAVNIDADADFGEFISKPGIERDESYLPDDQQADIEQLLSAQFGRHVALGNIPRSKWEDEELLDRARAILIKSQFPRRNGPGGKCSKEDRRIMTGDELPKPELDADMDNQIDAAFEERSNMRSLAVDGRAFRGMTEVIAETRSESIDEDSSGGWMSKLSGGLLG